LHHQTFTDTNRATLQLVEFSETRTSFQLMETLLEIMYHKIKDVVFVESGFLTLETERLNSLSTLI